MKPALLILLLLMTTNAAADNAAADRSSEVITALNEWNADLTVADRTSKYCKMSLSPFLFYRGSNHLFWQDFANDARLQQFGTANTAIWLQGDLHTENYGAYDNDNGDVVYGLNDFDESLIADYQYDVWRMAISLLLTSRDIGGFSHADEETVVDAFSEFYLDAMAAYRGNNDETQTYFVKQNTYGRLDNFLDDVEDKESRKKMLDKWAPVQNGGRQFDLNSEKLAVASTAMANSIQQAMSDYGTTLSGGLSYSAGYFQIKDIAKRLGAGTGSLGTPRYYLLIEGDTGSDNDDRILDIKRQSKPTPYHFLGSAAQMDYDDTFADEGERHAHGYQALTKHTDDHLGWMYLPNGIYSVRERSPFKETFPAAEEITSKTRFVKMAEQWGTILATAHARADKDYSSTLIDYSVDKAIDEQTDGQHAAFRSLVREIAFSYATQVVHDWNTFVQYLDGSCPQE